MQDLRFDREFLTVSARVYGSEPYEVEIAFTPRGDIADYWCDCPALSNYEGACKHIVAVLIALKCKLRNTGLSPARIDNSAAANEIINLFSGMDRQQKVPVNFENFLDVIKPSFSLTASAEFKIGLERLYGLKNLREFLSSTEHL